MKIEFYKYHGTGNDFILIDNRKNLITLNSSQIKQLCHRRFGIGADGLMLLMENNSCDFEMKYYNSDGNESSMCGNGGRCISAFAKHLGIINDKAHFKAIDGYHDASFHHHLVSLKMNNVNGSKLINGDRFIDTGSPHLVKFVDDVNNYDILGEGKKLREADEFKPGGCNVNFVSFKENEVFVRTFERGVEDETYSCGTGVTAAALVCYLENKINQTECTLNTPGGKLHVRFESKKPNFFENIFLTGPTAFVFKGEIEI